MLRSLRYSRSANARAAGVSGHQRRFVAIEQVAEQLGRVDEPAP